VVLCEREKIYVGAWMCVCWCASEREIDRNCVSVCNMCECLGVWEREEATSEVAFHQVCAWLFGWCRSWALEVVGEAVTSNTTTVVVHIKTEDAMQCDTPGPRIIMWFTYWRVRKWKQIRNRFVVKFLRTQACIQVHLFYIILLSVEGCRQIRPT
jgi:hypothetical protein